MATVNLVFFNTHKNIEAVTYRRGFYQTARIVLERMVRDLTCAYMPTDMGSINGDMISMWRFKGEHDEDDGIYKDSLSFTTTADIGFSPYPGCVREVAYYLEDEEEENGENKKDEDNKTTFRLMRREDPTPHKGESTSGAVLEMADGVGALKIVYVDDYGQEFDHWDLEERMALPRRIKITLTLGAGEDAFSFTATATPVLAGTSPGSSQG
jgi:hypothetical protein